MHDIFNHIYCWDNSKPPRKAMIVLLLYMMLFERD